MFETKPIRITKKSWQVNIETRTNVNAQLMTVREFAPKESSGRQTIHLCLPMVVDQRVGDDTNYCDTFFYI